ncbi:uncharacterized protein LOC133178513 [Saccostrea echinata]|uniref:uncharacterized protein LOC133178513 n=1 Tax=Saccostrea echinata TaxID=191078 RepID=UPI002A80C692|nr:uncharacterized protein LOC133178513 [Saccostrea echinata]
MANNSTDDTTVVLVPSHITTVNPNKYRYQTDVLEDPVILSVLGGMAAIVIVIFLRVLINKLSGERSEMEGTRIERLHRTISSISCFGYDDPPPPYPGKYSKTNVNYLPSYDSAMKMEQDRRAVNNLSEGTGSAVFSISSESSAMDSSSANNNETQNNNDVTNSAASVSTALINCENLTTDIVLQTGEDRKTTRDSTLHHNSDIDLHVSFNTQQQI